MIQFAVKNDSPTLKIPTTQIATKIQLELKLKEMRLKKTSELDTISNDFMESPPIPNNARNSIRKIPKLDLSNIKKETTHKISNNKKAQSARQFKMIKHVRKANRISETARPTLSKLEETKDKGEFAVEIPRLEATRHENKAEKSFIIQSK